MFGRKKKELEHQVLHIDSEIGNVMDMSSFIYDNQDVVFCFTRYKRIFTPYEEDKKFVDESIFEDTIRGYIRSAVDLGYDYLLEVEQVAIEFDGSIHELGIKEYIHLGDCKMSLYVNLEESAE